MKLARVLILIVAEIIADIFALELAGSKTIGCTNVSSYTNERMDLPKSKNPLRQTALLFVKCFRPRV